MELSDNGGRDKRMLPAPVGDGVRQPWSTGLRGRKEGPARNSSQADVGRAVAQIGRAGGP